MNQIVQVFVECDGCKCSEIIPLLIRDQHFEKDAGEKALGYRRSEVPTNWGAFTPLLCPRCQNNLTRLDVLRIAIAFSIRRSTSITATKLHTEFAKQKTHDRMEFTESEVDAEAWKLIERGIVQVDDKGILTLVNK